MKSMKKTIVISCLIVISITLLDYGNIPALLGIKSTNMNWDFYMGFLNVASVIVLYIVTFDTLNKREIIL